MYHDNVSKTNNGSSRDFGSKENVLPTCIYSCPDLGERCPVTILDTCLNKLPPKTYEDDIIMFYTNMNQSDFTLVWISTGRKRHTFEYKKK